MELVNFKDNVVSVKECSNKKSVVWSYVGFLKKDGKIVDGDNYYCSLCFQKEIIQTFKKTTSTSNMRGHLDKEHKGLDANIRKVDETQPTITQYVEKSMSSTYSSIEAIPKVPKRHLKVAKAGIKLCCNQLINLDVVFNDSLQNFLSEFSSIRQNNDTSESCVLGELENLFQGHQDRIKDELSTMNNICLSMFDYVYRKYEHILILKANYLDEEWKFRKATLSIEARDWKLDYIQPSGWIKSNITSYSISDKTLRFVAKDPLASRKSVDSIPCIGYIIASALHENFTDTVLMAYEKLKNIYTAIYFMRNSATTETMVKVSRTVQLMQRCEQVCLFPNTNLKDSLPPWHIQRHIFKEFIAEKDLLVDILETSDKCELLPEEIILENITDILVIYDCFMMIIKHIYCNSEPLISSKILVKQYLIEQLNRIVAEIKDETIRKTLEEIIEKLDKLIIVSEADLLASLLDVRSKDLSSTKEHLEKLKITPMQIIKKYLDIEKITMDSTEKSLPSKTPIRKNNRKSLFTRYKTTSPQGSLEENNIDLFLGEEITELTEDEGQDGEKRTGQAKYEKDEDEGVSIFDWWKKNENKYKSISILARKYLPILISSVPEEVYHVEFIDQLYKMSCINNHVRDKVTFVHYNNVLDTKNTH